MRLLIILFLLASLPCALAREYIVEDVEELQETADALQPGDTLKLGSGRWPDVQLVLVNSGTEDAPITLAAEEPGKAILHGATRIAVGGSHIVIEGLHFQGATTPLPPDSEGTTTSNQDANALIDFMAGPDAYATDSRITNCYFDACNPSENRRYHWVRLWGLRNRVDHCRFEGQDHHGVTVQIRLHQPDAEHRIDHNYFLDRKPGEGNGYECIQIGQSWASMSRGGCRVENNIFESCDGETEIISSKTCDNLIRGNLFLRSTGTLTIRHGNYTTVEGNVFIGGGKEGAGGVRVIGEGHRVIGNYFHEINSYTGGVIVINCGIPDGPLNGYAAANQALIANNILLHSRGNDIYLNGGFPTRNRILLPEGVIIRDNVIVHEFKYGPNFGGVALAGQLPDVQISNNLMNGKELGRPDVTGFEFTELSLVEQPNGLYSVMVDSTGETLPLTLPTIPQRSEVGTNWLR